MTTVGLEVGVLVTLRVEIGAQVVVVLDEEVGLAAANPENMYSDNGELVQTSSTKTVYSNSGKILTRENSENGNTTKSEFTYDDNGNETSYKLYSNGQLNEERKDYVYDRNKVTYTECLYDMNRTYYYTLIYAD